MSAEEHLEAVLKKYKSTLNTLFVDQSFTKDLKKNLKKLHGYYHYQLNNGQISFAEKKEFSEEYEFLLTTIKDVKQGNATADEAFKNVSLLSSNRKLKVICQNILNSCELIFWLMAAASTYALFVSFGVPILFSKPLLGATITIITSVAMIDAGMRAQKCIDKYQSFKAINQQEQLEYNAVNFFATQTRSETSKDSDDEVDLEHLIEQSPAYDS